MSEPAPWSYKLVEPETNQKLLQLLHGERDGFVQVGPKLFLFPKRFAEDGFRYFEFTPRATDTWIVTFPRSGTTLTQELIWLLSNNLDYKTAAQKPLTERFPFLEFESCINKKLLNELLNAVNNIELKKSLSDLTSSGIEMLEAKKERRFIKTHLPFSLLHPELLTCGAKVIYVARNPKDVATSYYHLHKLFKTLDFQGSFSEFWELFQNDKLQWCPFWEHINQAWTQRNNQNLLFLFYENIQNNLIESIETIGTFLGHTAEKHEIEKLAQHLDIQNFRQNSSVNFENLEKLGVLNKTNQRFIRQGGEITQKLEFTPELTKRADDWIQINLRATNLRFPTIMTRSLK